MDDARPDISGLRGLFIVFDGPDGAGKTTVRKHVGERLRAASVPVTECKDPGGTEIGDRIRSTLLDFDLGQMDVRCETLLFMASRAQLVSTVIRPALLDGHVVLCDRFVSATCAYQVAAGYDFDAIIKLAHYAIGTTWPDLTIILDVPHKVGFGRIVRRNGSDNHDQSGIPKSSAGLDSMERRPASFHEKVHANYLALPGRYPAPVEIVDATQPVEMVVDHVVAGLAQLARRRSPAIRGSPT